MILKTAMATQSDCYKQAKRMTNDKPVGIVVHSTGAPNEYIRRYVQPSKDDKNYDAIIADIGKNKYNNDWNHPASELDRVVCVHGVIGYNDKKTIETYQILPWNYCCWGVGGGSKGSYNYNPVAHIQFEICEDDHSSKEYFNGIWKEATEFCAYLCKKFGLNETTICSHKEAASRGYASNHGDPDHWFVKYGKTMNDFRADVKKLLATSGTTPSNPSPAPAKKTIDEIATEVIRGDWGNGVERKNRLEAAGYDYEAVQKRVTEILHPETVVPKKMYYVQVGAYSDKDNAVAMWEKLKAAGFPAIIKEEG